MAETLLRTATEAVANHFGFIDYAVLFVLLTISLGIGIYFGYFDKKEKTTEEYLFGGKQMKTIPIAISLVASQLSAISIISVPADVYTFGYQYVILICPASLMAILTINYAILPVFYNNNINNCYAYMDMRFDKKNRSLVTFIFFINVLIMLPVYSFLPSLALSQGLVTGLNIHLINAIVSSVCVIYTLTGGVKAVVWTDVVQAAVMIVTICIVFVVAIVKVGGFAEVFRTSVEGKRLPGLYWNFDLKSRQTVWNLAISLTMTWVGYVIFNQSCVQRIVSLPSLKDARRSLYLFGLGLILMYSCIGTLGLVIFTYYYHCDPIKAGIIPKVDQLIPYFVSEIVGWLPGMTGLFISCVFSASLSTISACLNSLAGLLYNDYIRNIFRFGHSEKRAQATMKSIIVLIGIYSVLCGYAVEKSGSIYQLFFIISAVSIGTTSGLFTLGMFSTRANATGAFCGGIASIVTVVWIAVNCIMLQARGEYVFHPLPTQIDGCPNHENITQIGNSTISAGPSLQSTDDDEFSIYKISFMWYTAIGVLSVWLIGLPLSYIVGDDGKSGRKINPNLLSPLVRSFLVGSISKEQQHVEMQQVIETDGDVKGDCHDDVNANGIETSTYIVK